MLITRFLVLFLFFAAAHGLVAQGGYTQFSVSGETTFYLEPGETSVDVRLDFTYSSWNSSVGQTYMVSKLNGSWYTMYGNYPDYRTYTNLGPGTHTIFLGLKENNKPYYDEETITIEVYQKVEINYPKRGVYYLMRAGDLDPTATQWCLENGYEGYVSYSTESGGGWGTWYHNGSWDVRPWSGAIGIKKIIAYY